MVCFELITSLSKPFLNNGLIVPHTGGSGSLISESVMEVGMTNVFGGEMTKACSGRMDVTT